MVLAAIFAAATLFLVWLRVQRQIQAYLDALPRAVRSQQPDRWSPLGHLDYYAWAQARLREPQPRPEVEALRRRTAWWVKWWIPVWWASAIPCLVLGIAIETAFAFHPEVRPIGATAVGLGLGASVAWTVGSSAAPTFRGRKMAIAAGLLVFGGTFWVCLTTL